MFPASVPLPVSLRASARRPPGWPRSAAFAYASPTSRAMSGSVDSSCIRAHSTSACGSSHATSATLMASATSRLPLRHSFAAAPTAFGTPTRVPAPAPGPWAICARNITCALSFSATSGRFVPDAPAAAIAANAPIAAAAALVRCTIPRARLRTVTIPVFVAPTVARPPSLSARSMPRSLARPGIGLVSTPRVAGRLASYGTGSPRTWLQSTPPARGRLLRLVFDTHLHPKTLLQPTPVHRGLPQIRSTTSTPIGRSPVSTCTA